MFNHCKVSVVSRDRFNYVLAAAGIDDANVEKSGLAYISIHSTQAVETLAKYHFVSDHANVLNLVFDDITDKDVDVLEQCPGSKLFSDEQAEVVLDFIKLNRARKFLIHCTAGVSRSGAVGEFVADVLEITYQDFKQENPNTHPNAYVLMLLRRALRRRMNEAETVTS